jgi:hypothetical protein
MEFMVWRSRGRVLEQEGRTFGACEGTVVVGAFSSDNREHRDRFIVND